MVNGETSFVDTKPYIQHDPVIGYRYVPNTKLSLQRPGGGSYCLAINAAGIRSDREYSFKKPNGVRRIIVCGDSMAAGQYVSNSQRFSELLERRVQGIEVINLALEGSGTDQQALLYEHLGQKYEHDLVLLLPFLQNIRRNMVEAREGVDPKTGARVLRPKPRFELVGGNLILRNVPVPKDVLVSDDAKMHVRTDTEPSKFVSLKNYISAMRGATLLKSLIYSVVPWEPFPEYRDEASASWLLMAAIVRRFRELAQGRPLVLAPTFYSSYVRFRMSRNYWNRFSSLTTICGIYAIDLLPYFKAAGAQAMRCFQDPYDMHFSSYGNLILAEAIQDGLTRLKLI